ncbi:MAG: hypothetical protein WAW96_13405 [Alphaproteobacteria bacterium]
MFIRFIVHEIDSDSGRRQGLFQAAKALRESGRLAADDDTCLMDIREWFNENLERPERLAFSSRPNARATALSWFKDTATEHIAKMREMQGVLEKYGITVEMITARRLGYILYEDEYQIAAYPFSDTPT